MKRVAGTLAIVVIFLLGSAQVSPAQDTHHEMKSMSTADSLHVQDDKKGSAVASTKADTLSSRDALDVKAASSIKEIVERYLQLKNALAADKTKDAATAGKEMFDAMKSMDRSLLTPGQKKLYEDIEDDAREHAEHIGENAGNIEHQREHFDMLSKDVYDLVKAFGGGQVLYKDFCPMYNDKKGGIWLSETKSIQNPYYGKKMPTCGSVKEEMK